MNLGLVVEFQYQLPLFQCSTERYYSQLNLLFYFFIQTTQIEYLNIIILKAVLYLFQEFCGFSFSNAINTRNLLQFVFSCFFFIKDSRVRSEIIPVRFNGVLLKKKWRNLYSKYLF